MREICPSPGVPVTEVGASGVVYGVTAGDAVDQEPAPTWFVADTLNTYDVPLVSPVTVVLVTVETPSANVVHVEPLSDDRCTV